MNESNFGAEGTVWAPRGRVGLVAAFVALALLGASACSTEHVAGFRVEKGLFISEGTLDVPHVPVALVQVNRSGFGVPFGPIYYGIGPSLEAAKRDLVREARASGADGLIGVEYRAEGVRGLHNVATGLLHGAPRIEIRGIAVKLGEAKPH